MLGIYTSFHNKIKLRCNLDGYEWDVRPADILRSGRCPRCSQNERYTTESFKEKLRSINPNIEVIGEYVNSKTKLLCRCLIDGYEWEKSAGHLLSQNCGCPKCRGHLKKTHITFVHELERISPDIEIMSEYQSRHKKVKCRCRVDGYEWESTPGNLLHGWGCPRCKISRGERRIANYLDNHDIEYKREYSFSDCKNIHVLLFDFYLPNENMVIEYDGEQHFMPVTFGGKNDDKAYERFIECQHRDNEKNEYCKKNNITLIRIPYTEFNNIEDKLDNIML